jgi:hypothetical protein
MNPALAVTTLSRPAVQGNLGNLLDLSITAIGKNAGAHTYLVVAI